jgi:hypothetical protein
MDYASRACPVARARVYKAASAIQFVAEKRSKRKALKSVAAFEG